MNVIAYTHKGKVHICIPQTGYEIDFVMRKDVPSDATDVMVLGYDSLPSREFRNAWEIVNGAVVVNQEKAERLRAPPAG